MLLQIPFLKQWTMVQVFQAVDIFRTEPRPGKTFLVERTMVGRVVKHRAQLFELVNLNVFDGPVLRRGRELCELVVAGAIAPASGQLTVGAAQERLQPARQGVVRVQQRI